LATGSRAIVPPIPGVDLEGVSTVRTSQDAVNILIAKSYLRCVLNIYSQEVNCMEEKNVEDK